MSGFADANDQLDRFGSLQCANGSRQDTKHTAFGAARHEVRAVVAPGTGQR